MKCVVVGDIFISPEIMEKECIKFPKRYTEIKKIYFGENDREKMRNVVKQIEEKEIDSIKIPHELKEEIVDADVVMVHLCPITKEMIESAKKLKLILSNRGGLENIDVYSAEEKGIKVINNPIHNANAVAEYTIGLILNEVRNINRSSEALKQGVWRENYPNSPYIRELYKMTIGIIGYGNIGRLLAKRLKGFDCKILAYSPNIETNYNFDNIDFVSMDELLEKSDVVTLHARTEEKKPIIGINEFKKMKKDCYFINTARSYLVNMNDLYIALKNKYIMGAAIDVFDVEPLPLNHELLTLDNVTLTNHRAGDTINSYNDSPEMLFNEAETLFTQKIKRI